MDAIEREHVLLVDDDPAILQAVARTLEREGIATLQAEGIRTALRHLARCRGSIRLVVCDLSLGDEDGLALVRHLRRRRRYREVRTLVLSAWGNLDARVDTLAHNNFCFLSKPLSAAELVQSVRRMLNGSLPTCQRG